MPQQPSWTSGLEIRPLDEPKRETPASPLPPPESVPSGAMQQIQRFLINSPQGQMLIGAGKGAAHTVSTLGSLWHKIPGVSALVDRMYQPGASEAAFSGMNTLTQPEGGFQKAGYLTEQVAEAVAPGGVISQTGVKLASKVPALLRPVVRGATEAAGSAGIATAQGGDPKTAAIIGGALGTAIPAAQSVIASQAPKLKASALDSIEQALGATKERFKAMAQKIAPDILRRGLKGNREQLQAMAQTAIDEIGPQIDTAIQQYGARQAGTQPIVTALETAKDAFRTMTPNGMVEFEPKAIAQLSDLQEIVQQLGKDARVDQLVALRRAWDTIVARAGGFAHRAPGAIGVPLADASEAAAKREATTAIRQVLDQAVPELTTLNKEFSFWKNLDDVVTQTLQRKGPQGKGLGSQVAEVGGAVVGSAAGAGGVGSFLAGKLAKAVDGAFKSPRWKLVSAGMKDKIAGLMASGKWQEAALQVQRAVGTQGSKLAVSPSGGR